MGRPWVLAVDLGSGGPKVGAVDLDGNLLATAFTAVPTIHTDDGGSEQDVHLWWRGIREAVRSFLDAGVVRGGDLHAVGLTGQYSSVVPVDGHGQPTGACLMWSDRRGAPYAARAVGGRIAGWAPDVLLRGIRYAGTVPLPTGECPLGHELWLRHRQPDVYARSAVLLEPVDYLGLRFSGRAAATPASMWMSAVVDTRPGRPARYVPSLVRRYGRDPARLPELVPTGSVLGGVLPSVADELGVRPEAPVVCGVPDQHAAYVGSGATEDFLAHLVVSTTSWQSCRIPFRRMDPIRLLTSIPAIEADSYLVFTDQASAGYCLAWWTDRLAEAAQHAGGKPPDYSQTLELAADAAPGSGGMLFLPWLRGERTPADDRTARAAFVNASAHSTLADMTRAILEGVAFNSRWLTQTVERFIRRPVPSLRILGGAAQSDLWCQVFADVLARPMERVADPWFAQVRGAALLALVGLGEATVDQAASRVRVSERFLPTPGSAKVYDPLFTEFTGLFASLRPHHRRLNAEAAPP